LLRQSSEVGPGYYFYLEGLVGFDGGGSWVVLYFIKARSCFYKVQRGRGHYECY